IAIAEKCTKTSSPVWRWMNPKPFEALNHLTVPCSFTCQPHTRNPDRVEVGDIGIALRLLIRFLVTLEGVLAEPRTATKYSKSNNRYNYSTTKRPVCPRLRSGP